MTHDGAANPLALIRRQRCDGIDIGGAWQRQTLGLEPTRGHHGMTDQLLFPIGEHVEATGRDIGKEVSKIVLLMGYTADM